MPEFRGRPCEYRIALGYGSRTDEQSVQTSTYTPSVIGSTTGSVKIEANGPVKIDGSAIAAAQDIGISG
ncbi:hypothetical protein, partial [Acetobacter indonesiensis]|uniref:hypothetical protein n=1 Tax=Acetobacter indonesiensis TaxID=104101 RepID=UPI00066247A5